jgi:hypothetical protein
VGNPEFNPIAARKKKEEEEEVKTKRRALLFQNWEGWEGSKRQVFLHLEWLATTFHSAFLLSQTDLFSNRSKPVRVSCGFFAENG